MSILRLGFIVKYLSVPVMTGFVTGAAFIIVGNQLRAFFGLNCEKGRYFYTTVYNAMIALDTICWKTTLLSVLSLLLLSAVKFFNVPRWFPAPFSLMLVTTLLSYGCNFAGMGIAVIGEVPFGIPTPMFPTIIAPQVMISQCFMVALVIYVSSLGLAKSLARDSLVEYQVSANSELVAFGMASMIGSFFLAFPPSASFSRSALCFEMGARTPLHGIFTACLLCIALYVTTALKFLPKSVLSAIIAMSVRRLLLNGWKELFYLAKARSAEFVESFLCLCAVCFLGITEGVLIGAALSLINYLWKTSFTDIVKGDRLNMSEIGIGLKQGHEQKHGSSSINSNLYTKFEDHEEPINSGRSDLLLHQHLIVIQPKAGIYYANVAEVIRYVKQVIKSNEGGLELDLIYTPFLDSTSARMLLDCLAYASTTIDVLIISNCCDNVRLDLGRYANTKMHQITLNGLKIKAPYFDR